MCTIFNQSKDIKLLFPYKYRWILENRYKSHIRSYKINNFEDLIYYNLPREVSTQLKQYVSIYHILDYIP